MRSGSDLSKQDSAGIEAIERTRQMHTGTIDRRVLHIYLKGDIHGRH